MLTLDGISTNQKLKKILMHIPGKGKALFLVIESSGMRIWKAPKSNIDDLHLKEEPGKQSLLFE